jgi:hypothetical protein
MCGLKHLLRALPLLIPCDGAQDECDEHCYLDSEYDDSRNDGAPPGMYCFLTRLLSFVFLWAHVPRLFFPRVQGRNSTRVTLTNLPSLPLIRLYLGLCIGS